MTILIGGSGDEQLNGGFGDDTIMGMGGDDRLDGSGGNDLLDGGTENDSIIGGYGDDTMLGGEGNDSLYGSYGDDSMDGGAGNDDVWITRHDDGSPQNSSLTLIGGAGLDHLSLVIDDGSQVSAILDGGDDADMVETARVASFTLDAGSGNDTVSGAASFGLIDMGAGDDTLIAMFNGSETTATLGEGADRLQLYGLDLNPSHTTVTDFQVGPGGDLLDFSRVYSQLIGWNGSNNIFTDGHVRLVQAGADTIVQVDRDAAGGAYHWTSYFTLQGVGPADLTADNFTDFAATGPYALSLTGGAGDDHLVGAATDDTLSGADANDSLEGGQGVDLLDGGAGNDTLIGGDGADSLVGGAGDDVFVIDALDHVSDASGVDEVRTDLAAYTLAAGLENLTGLSASGQALTGNGAANSIAGGDGADTLDGGVGADTLNGGAGDDLYVVGSGDVVVDASGVDTAQTALAAYALAAGLEKLTGTSASGQALTGNDAANTITGGTGADTLDGGVGADRLDGGSGNDVYVVDTEDVVVDASGVDEVRTSMAAYALASGLEKLTGLATTGQALTGNDAANTITGGTGADTLDGAAGADSLVGGAGDDVFIVGAGDSVSDVSGSDEVRTSLAAYVLGAGVEKLTGLSASGQALTGNSGDNLIVGANGADTLDGAAGADSLVGGAGDDVFIVGAGDSVSDLSGTDEVRTALASYTLGKGLEKLTGLSASGQALTGNTGDNTILGGAGADTIVGGLGNDSLSGGAGVDTLSYAASSHGMIVDLTAGTATQIVAGAPPSGEADSISLFENVIGSAKADTIGGDAHDNLLQGGKGDDRIEGANGNDTIDGGGGSDTAMYVIADKGVRVDLSIAGAQNTGAGLDTLIGIENLFGSFNDDLLKGDAGANELMGFDGDDTLIGGGGKDLLTGFTGDDTFRYLALSDSGGKTIDLIADLEQTDRVDLKAIDADTTQDGDQAFHLVDKFGKHAGEMTLVYNAKKDFTVLSVDVDGNGKADMTIHIAGDHEGFTGFVF